MLPGRLHHAEGGPFQVRVFGSYSLGQLLVDGWYQPQEVAADRLADHRVDGLPRQLRAQVKLGADLGGDLAGRKPRSPIAQEELGRAEDDGIIAALQLFRVIGRLRGVGV